MNDQTVEQRTSIAPSGWHHLPEVFLTGLAGGVLWFVFVFPTELEPWWLYGALCTALPAAIVAVLLVGPRRPPEAAVAFGTLAIVVAAVNMSTFGQLLALLAFGSVPSVGLALGIVAGRLAQRLIFGTAGRGSHARLDLIGGLVGAAAAWLLPSRLLATQGETPVTSVIEVILLAWVTVVPSLWLASILTVAFLDHRKRTRATA